jgi:3-methyl-2-oxobutanoate hydroxymethyltransferase
VGIFLLILNFFLKKYVNLSELILKAVEEYKDEVISGRFPGKEHTFTIKEEELKKICEEN